MDLDLKITKENEDGSAEAVVTFDKEALELLVQYGIIAMLKEAINNESFNPKKKKVKK